LNAVFDFSHLLSYFDSKAAAKFL